MIDELAGAAEVHRVDVAGTEVVCRTWGEGDPLVLLHGAGGSWRHWVRNIAELARRRRVVAPDLPGFAESATPPENTIESLAATTAGALTELLDGSRFDLAAMSFGGIVAGHVAAHLGDAVRTLVLVSVGGIGMPARVEHDGAVDARSILSTFMFAQPGSVDDQAIRIHTEDGPRGRFRTGGLPASTSLLKALPAVTAEIHGVYSDGDAFFEGDPQKPLGIVRGVAPGLHGWVIEGSGHWIPYEKAAELNALLDRILDGSD